MRADVLQGLSVGLTVLWDPAMQGTVAERQLEGIDPRHRALMVADQSKWAVGFDPQRSPAANRRRAGPTGPGGEFIAGRDLQPGGGLDRDAVDGDQRAARAGPGGVRPPAVAGRFYPGAPAEIDRMIDRGSRADRKPERWAGVMVPHAGWIYSGRLAAAALARVEIPSRVIVICPKHHAEGADWAVAPHRAWAIPGKEVPSDPELAQRLAEAVTGLELDADAHEAEHAIEVQLPILARLAPASRVVGIAIHGGDLAPCNRPRSNWPPCSASCPSGRCW